MPFKPSLVAPEENPAAAPFLGFPVTEIVLEQPNGESAVVPAMDTPDDRSKIEESITGADSKFERLKRRSITFEVDYIDESKFEQLNRLYHNGRDVFISPNYNRGTLASLPLQRTLDDATGRTTWECNRSGKYYVFDEQDEVLRSWGTDAAAFPFNGHWMRYLASHRILFNAFTTPAPTSTGTGWSVVSGTGTVNYTESVQTPILERRNTSGQKGVAILEGQSGAEFEIQSNASFSSSDAIGAKILLRWAGFVSVDLRDAAGTTLLDSVVESNDGRWRVIHLYTSGAAGTNGVRIRVTQLNGDRSAIFASGVNATSAANARYPVNVPDWYNSGSSINDLIVKTDSLDLYSSALTFSFFLKYSEADIGIFEEQGTPGIWIRKLAKATNSDALEVYSYDGVSSTQLAGQILNFGSTYGLTEGDWVHVVIVLNPNHAVYFYVNKQFLSTGEYHHGNYGSNWRLLQTFGAQGAANAGLSHFRIDGYEWSDTEVNDHYDTFFAKPGKAIIQPVFGKLGHIAELEMDAARPGGGDWQFTGSIVWEELAATNWAGVVRQEGDV